MPNCMAFSIFPLHLIKSEIKPEAKESPAPVVSIIFLFSEGLAEYKYFPSETTTPSAPFVITTTPGQISSIFLNISFSFSSGTFVKKLASS